MRTVLLAALAATFMLAAPVAAENTKPVAPTAQEKPAQTCAKVSPKTFNRWLDRRDHLTGQRGKHRRGPVCVRPHLRRLQAQINQAERCARTDCKWKAIFNRLPASDQTWARRIGACESGNNPTTNTGNGFLGAFQWVLSTWHMAGGSGSPTSASWHEQAVRAVRWRNKTNTMQWPACSIKLGYA